MPSGAPYPDYGVQLRSLQAHGNGRGQVAFLADLDTRSGLPYLLDEALVPRPVQYRHRYLRVPAAVGLRYDINVLGHRRVYVDPAPHTRPDDELAHVHVGRP